MSRLIPWLRRATMTAAPFLLPATSSAAIIWDYSPDTLGASGPPFWSNNSNGQNFAERFTIANSTVLSGMDIFSANVVGALGQPVTVRLFADNGATPGALIAEILSALSIIDDDGATSIADANRKHADFVYALAAGSYWIGMSGTDSQLGQMSLGSVFFIYGSNRRHGLPTAW